MCVVVVVVVVVRVRVRVLVRLGLNDDAALVRRSWRTATKAKAMATERTHLLASVSGVHSKAPAMLMFGRTDDGGNACDSDVYHLIVRLSLSLSCRGMYVLIRIHC